MPIGVTYVTEGHLFFVKGTLKYLALGILGGRATMGIREGWYGPGCGPEICHELHWIPFSHLTKKWSLPKGVLDCQKCPI